MMHSVTISRRDCLKLAATSLGALSTKLVCADSPVAPKLVAGVVTTYFERSHADVILGKILAGWQQDGGPGPALKLASLYVDQFTKHDIARATCGKYGVPIFPTIEQAVTVGSDRIPVDGVLSIGEHGSYDHNSIGQHLYPRRRFFAEITAAFEKYGRVVPVFSDKHLGPTWADARWMYDKSLELKVPLMAGSSMPAGYRRYEIDLPLNSDIESAVGIGYSDLETYGFHALEFYQYHVERRRGAERGVRSVQCLEGPDIWRAIDEGRVSREALQAAYDAVPKEGHPDLRQDNKAALFLFEYADGLHGAVLMLSCVQGTAIGLRLKGQPRPIATAFDERTVPRHPHFAYQLKAIERMIHTGRPSYPVERTLLTSGILDRAMNSRALQGRVLETPELSIAYQPVDYPFAPHVDLREPPAASGG